MNHAGGSAEDGDGQKASSSSLKTNIEDAMTSFTEQWQRELEVSPKHDSLVQHASKTHYIDSLEDDTTSIDCKAKNLFLKGVEHERNGKVYEAIQYYKRAVQLVPDVESRLYEFFKLKSRDGFECDEGPEIKEKDNYDEDGDLMARLSKIICQNQCVCFPLVEQSAMHISALPMEIVLYILRWVVSSELDLRSLEMFSEVCRGFYVAARDAEIWRLACVRVWGGRSANCGTFEPKYRSWREMYVQRPRLRYNGCYISKTTYMRHGENSFQDQFYRPWHLVEYFRYLRFFPDGRVLMLTSSDEVQSCVNSLKNPTPKNPSVLVGRHVYDNNDNWVILTLRKQEAKGNNNNNNSNNNNHGQVAVCSQLAATLPLRL